ncbi:transglutaminase-like cysteine peptidase [Sphingomonas sp.]|uniref:transglutaminase-like cysteine peptidase n=1 Tax=Sphingomonas sp. TaxID=28214 RepID=UPI00286A75C6|nr:transglutaminase-like cysteine peptidase [Sphingomonas sp.]
MDNSFKSRPLGRFAAALAVSLLPAPALAQAVAPQPATGYSLRYDKTEAILGGAPSRLAAILAGQQGQVSAQPLLQPAALSIRTPTYAVLRETRPGDSKRFSPSAFTGRPDVFGSVALSVGHTPLDQRWHSVEGRRVVGAPATYAASLRGEGELARVEAVNRYVNARVQFVDDSRQYGRADLWAAASDTLRRGRGDCEDYAIAKFQMLRTAGVSDRNLYLVIARDLVRRADHAMLVVRSSGRMLVLDSGSNRILDADEISDYRPVLTFSASGAWTHGYRRDSAPLAAPMTMASATVAALVPSSAAGLSD